MTMIRTAVEADIPGIASVLVQTWQRSLKGIVGDDYLSSLDVEHQQRRHSKMFGRPGVGYWVFEDEGQVSGFVSGGPIRYPIGEADCELYAIYILPEHQGRGAGAGLFGRLQDHCLTSKWCRIGVLVLEANPAVKFYQSLGFARVDDEMITLGESDYREHKMVLQIAAQQDDPADGLTAAADL